MADPLGLHRWAERLERLLDDVEVLRAMDEPMREHMREVHARLHEFRDHYEALEVHLPALEALGRRQGWL